MRSATFSLVRSFRAKNHRLRRFIARHLTFWLMLLILGAVVLSSVLAAARDQSRKNTAGVGQKRGTKFVADVLNEKGRLKLGGKGNSDTRGADLERLEAELFVNPPAPLARTALTATSFATLRATPIKDNGQDNSDGTKERNALRAYVGTNGIVKDFSVEAKQKP